MKKTCGPLFVELFNQRTSYAPLAFYAGFVAGQAEKVYLGACPAALIHPHGATRRYWDDVLNVVNQTAMVYDLGVTVLGEEIWIHREENAHLVAAVASMEVNSPAYHQHRAMLCGVPASEIDPTFHERFTDERRERVTKADLRTDLPCDDCHTVTETTVNEIWSRAHPEGRLKRLCDNCSSHYGAG